MFKKFYLIIATLLLFSCESNKQEGNINSKTVNSDSVNIDVNESKTIRKEEIQDTLKETSFTLKSDSTKNSLISKYGQVKPFDESNKDSMLVEFLNALKSATKAKNSEFIKTNLANETYTPFEGGEKVSPKEFYDYYFNNQDTKENIWSSLNHIFSIGGGGFKNDSEYCMPYTSANLHKSEPFSEVASYVIALSSDTKVYEKPNNTSDIVKTLDYEIIKISPDLNDFSLPWLEVITDNGEIGYVESSKIEHTISVRCGLVKEDGNWKIKYCDGFD